MKFVSTRGGQAVSIDEALLAGLADDGGLYVPVKFPRLSLSTFDQAHSIDQVAACLLAPFFADSSLADDLPEICREVFDFAVPTKLTGRADLRLLELFHGPTAAFKDFGARFLAACLKRLQAQATVLVATSGDTGVPLPPHSLAMILCGLSCFTPRGWCRRARNINSLVGLKTLSVFGSMGISISIRRWPSWRLPTLH